MLSDATEPKGSLTIRTLAMPADTNPAGDIFGGWVMSQMDMPGPSPPSSAAAAASLPWPSKP